MATQKKKRSSNSYWMKYGGSGPKAKFGWGNMGNLISGGVKMGIANQGMNAISSQFSNPIVGGIMGGIGGNIIGNALGGFFENGGNPTTDPTFKTWFAKNAARPDVMRASNDPNKLKELFLGEIQMESLPLFSGEIDDKGNIDKSQRSLETSSKIIGGLSTATKKYGGYLPTIKAEFGYRGHTSSPTDYTRDYSGVADRNRNWQQSVGAVGDTNLLQYIPVVGHALDLVADVIGFKGDKQQHFDNVKDAQEAQGTLRMLNRSENKKSLDLSTRTDALSALGGFNERQPTLQEDLYPEVAQTMGSYISGGGYGQLAGLFKGGTGTGGAGIPDDVGVGDSINPAGEGVVVGRYGGKMPKAESGIHIKPENRGKFTNWASSRGMSVSEAANKVMGNTDGYSSDVVKMANFAKNAAGWKKAFGGANMMEGIASATQSGIAGWPGHAQGHFNPYSKEALFQSTGMTQSGFEQGGEATENYEAEGGEVIMHEPGTPPATSGDLQPVDGDANESMLSMLEGSSHDNGGEEVSGDGEQYVFSKKLKSKSWKTSFADAAEKIGKNISKYEKASEEGDQITKSTAEAMLQAWVKKLADLRQEQESARQEKFMEMVNSGAPVEELMQNFPDLTEQMMAEQQLAQQGGAPQQGAPMAENPMGNIDMSGLSQASQELVGAKYGLPRKYENGGESDFNPYSFNTYLDELGLFGDQSMDFDLGKSYKPRKGDVIDYLTLNAPKEGYTINEELYEPDALYDKLIADYETARTEHLTELNIPTERPSRMDYRTVDEESGENQTFMSEEDKLAYQQDMARYKLYNSGLPVGWDENYGSSAGISDRKYWKSRYNQLMSEEGMSKDRANRIVEQEKMQRQNAENANLELEADEFLTDEEKAEKFIQQQANMKKNSEMFKNLGNNLLNLAPTLYNLAKGNQKPEVEQHVSNKFESDILKELALLKDNKIDDLLEDNEESFNMLKYMARNSGGSSGQFMNTLITGQNIKTKADADAYLQKHKLDMTGSKIAAESLYNLGERDRAEGVRVSGVNAENRAAVEAFKAKGWEGLSGYNQLKQKMQNSANRDEQLKGLLGQIYPDAEMYMNKGEIDMEKILKENPELMEYFQKYFKED